MKSLGFLMMSLIISFIIFMIRFAKLNIYGSNSY